MKKTTLFVIIGMISLFGAAQTKTSTHSTFSLGVESGLPTGDFSNTHEFGIGASAKIAADCLCKKMELLLLF